VTVDHHGNKEKTIRCGQQPTLSDQYGIGSVVHQYSSLSSSPVKSITSENTQQHNRDE